MNKLMFISYPFGFYITWLINRKYKITECHKNNETICAGVTYGILFDCVVLSTLWPLMLPLTGLRMLNLLTN